MSFCRYADNDTEGGFVRCWGWGCSLPAVDDYGDDDDDG